MTHRLIATRRRALTIAASGLVLPAVVAGRAMAQEQTQEMPAEYQEYMAQTMAAGAFTQGVAQIGLEKAENPMLRQFAQLEIGEITRVVEVLSGAGAPPPPQTVEGEKAAMVTQLQETPAGPEFDRLFVEAQLMGHQEGLAIQQMLSGEPEINVPTATAKLAEQSITSHIAMLQNIQSMMG